MSVWMCSGTRIVACIVLPTWRRWTGRRGCTMPDELDLTAIEKRLAIAHEARNADKPVSRELLELAYRSDTGHFLAEIKRLRALLATEREHKEALRERLRIIRRY